MKFKIFCRNYCCPVQFSNCGMISCFFFNLLIEESAYIYLVNNNKDEKKQSGMKLIRKIFNANKVNAGVARNLCKFLDVLLKFGKLSKLQYALLKWINMALKCIWTFFVVHWHIKNKLQCGNCQQYCRCWLIIRWRRRNRKTQLIALFSLFSLIKDTKCGGVSLFELKLTLLLSFICSLFSIHIHTCPLITQPSRQGTSRHSSSY